MLFKPPAEGRLDAAQALLTSWNDEADRFRVAAREALAGTAPAESVLRTAEEARHELAALEDEIAWLLDGVPAGDPDFSRLLHAQVAAAALRESVDNSLDVLDRFIPEPGPGPISIRHEADAMATPPQ